MLQLGKKLILFGLFAVVSYILLTILGGTFLPSFATRNLIYGKGNRISFLAQRLKEVDTTKNVDVLILGSSHAFRGYDPRVFEDQGLRMFNLGSSSQTFLQTEYLLNKYLDSLNPKLVIVDVYPVLLDSDGIESSLDHLSNGKIDYGLANLVIKQKNIRLINTLIYASFQQIIEQEERSYLRQKGGRDRYVSGGYVENTSDFNEEKKLTRNYISPKPIQLQALESVLEMLQKRKIKYAIVQAPTTTELDNSYTNIDELDVFLKQKGLYYNFNRILSLDHQHFKDHSHLNQRGVTTFNLELLKILQETSLVPLNNHRASVSTSD